jgi:alcohol dehydrogenase
MQSFETRSTPRLVAGAGALAKLPGCVQGVGGTHVLLVTDAGLIEAGHAGHAIKFLEDAGVKVTCYDHAHVNPSESDIEACREFAAGVSVDCIVGFGGGSSMDTAKGCNFLLSNGGRMSDYKGYGLAKEAMLPFIAVPTTAGTGSECQSYAVVSRDGSHEKIACGDPKALARVALLDPELTVSQPLKVASLTALDALSHALEAAVCTRKNPVSAIYAKEGFKRIASGIEMVLQDAALLEHRASMQIGAAFAGMAIENSMLGAAHAAANPLTAKFGAVHGHAVALMLPEVMRWNREERSATAVYLELGGMIQEPLVEWVEQVIGLAKLPDLAGCGVTKEAIPGLAADAATQWTGQFNPRPLTEEDFAGLYGRVLG